MIRDPRSYLAVATREELKALAKGLYNELYEEYRRRGLPIEGSNPETGFLSSDFIDIYA